MKNTIKLKNIQKAKAILRTAGFIALVAVFGFSLAACDGFDIGGKKDEDKGGPSAGIKTLILSGQVYVAKENQDPPSVTFEAYKKEGDLTVSVDGMTEKGTIKNGQLSITLGTPTSLVNVNDGDDITFSPSSAKGFELEYLSIESSDGRQRLVRGNATMVGPRSGTREMVTYLYVDRDVTMSGIETTKTNDENWWSDITEISTTKAFSLALKEGWNTVYVKIQSSFNESSKTREEIRTISLANPGSLKWVLDGSDDGGGVTPTPQPSNVLQGTTWEATDEDDVIYTLDFIDASYCTIEIKAEDDDEEDWEHYEGEYLVNGSNVVMDFDEWEIFTGVIDGDTLVIEYIDDIELTFHKLE